MSWKDYIASLSDAERYKLLEVILTNEEANGQSEYRYREEDEDSEECIYWEASGEPLIERFVRSDWVIASFGDLGKLFDANGVEIENVVKANLKTGWCKYYKSSNGVYEIGGDGKMKTFRSTFPAPLRFERRER